MKDEDTSDLISGVMRESPEFYTEDRTWFIFSTKNQEAFFV